MDTKIELAVFLLAGRGSRINKYTENIPKCLIEVNGKALLHDMLDKLAGCGTKKSIMVIGYLGSQIRDSVGLRWKGMEIEYVENIAWETTNNIYSLFLANNVIDRDFYLIEGDIIISDDSFALLEGKRNFLAVSRWSENLDGTMVSLTGNQLDKFYLKKDIPSGYDISTLFKTVNIYGLDISDYKTLVCPEMEHIINSGETGTYYEKAFANLSNSGKLVFRAIDFSENKWAEIDNEEDYRYAIRLFGS